MPELTFDVGLLADVTNPEQLLIKLDPAAVATPEQVALLESKDQKGVPGGYAPLGADNLVPAEFLPESLGGGATTVNLPFYDIRDYGALLASPNNQTAIQAAINAAAAAGGGRVFVPAGAWNTGPLVLGNRVWLEGASMRGARLVLVANTNADFITCKVSTNGTTDPNAQFVGLANLTIDGNLSQNLTSGRGVFFTQNPVSTPATADEFTDPRMQLRDVFIIRTRGNGFEQIGRGETTLHNVNVFFCGGHGIVPDADTFLSSCKTGATGRAGFYIGDSSVRLSNCKAFYAGDSSFGTPTDGHGFHINNSGRGVTLSNCEAQDNKGAGLRIANSAHRTIAEGFVADSNSKHGRGLYAGVEISASRHCVVTAVAFERNDPALASGDANYCPQRYGLKLESGATFNKVRLTHSATSGGPVVDEAIMPSSNTTALLSNNDISINGQDGYRAVTYASSWIPEVYSGSVMSMTLTGNTTVANTGTTVLSQAHAGSKMEIVFTQDATGGRTVSFGNMYRVSGSVDTAVNAVSVVRLTYNGSVWAGAWERNESASATGGVRRYKPGQYYGSHGNEFNTNQRAPNNFVCVPFEVHEAMPIDRIGFNITTSSAGNTRMGIYADDDGYPGARLLDAGVISTGTTGSREITISYTLQPGFYWLASNTESGSATFRSHLGINPLMPLLPASVTLVNGYEDVSVAAGSLPATAPAGMTLIGAATRMVVRAA